MEDRNMMQLKINARMESDVWCNNIAGSVLAKRRKRNRSRVIAGSIAVCIAVFSVFISPRVAEIVSPVVAPVVLEQTQPSGSYVLQQVSGTGSMVYGESWVEDESGIIYNDGSDFDSFLISAMYQ